MASRRSDLVIEVSDTTDGSGHWTGEWIDTGGFRNVLITHDAGGSLYVEHSSDASTVLGFLTGPVPSGTVYGVPTRYFRVAIPSGTANDQFFVVGRVWD